MRRLPNMKKIQYILILLCAALCAACSPTAEERLLQADEAANKGNYVEAAQIISQFTPGEVSSLSDKQQQKLQELILTIELCDKEALKILEQQ